MKRKIISVMLLLSMMFMFFCGCTKEPEMPLDLVLPDKFEITINEPDERAGQIIKPYSTVVFPYTGKKDVMVYVTGRSTFILYQSYTPEDFEGALYEPFRFKTYQRGWPVERGTYEVIVGDSGTDYYLGIITYITVIIE